jgi:ribosomal protein S2
MVRRKRHKWRTVKTLGMAEKLREFKTLEKKTAKKIYNAKRRLEKELAGVDDINNRKFARYIKLETKSKTTVGPLIDRQKSSDR